MPASNNCSSLQYHHDYSIIDLKFSSPLYELKLQIKYFEINTISSSLKKTNLLLFPIFSGIHILFSMSLLLAKGFFLNVFNITSPFHFFHIWMFLFKLQVLYVISFRIWLFIILLGRAAVINSLQLTQHNSFA